MILHIKYYYVDEDNDGFYNPLGIAPTEELAWQLIEKDLNKKYKSLFDLSGSNSISKYIDKVCINKDLRQVNFVVKYDYILNEEISDYSIINYYINEVPFYNTI